MDAATLSALSFFMSARTTFAPDAANNRAVASPKPDPPPVTINVLPCNFIELSFSLYVIHRCERDVVLLGPVFQLFLRLDREHSRELLVRRVRKAEHVVHALHEMRLQRCDRDVPVLHLIYA